MTESNDQVIAKVRELDANASDAPWISSKIDGMLDEENDFTELDCDFIAASRTLLPDLASRLESAGKEIERLRRAEVIATRALERIRDYEHNMEGYFSENTANDALRAIALALALALAEPTEREP